MKAQERGILDPLSINGDPHKQICQYWSSLGSLIKLPINIGRGGWTNYIVKLTKIRVQEQSMVFSLVFFFFFKCLRLRKISSIQRIVSGT